MPQATPSAPDDRRVRRRRILLAVSAWLIMFAWANIPPFRGNILHEKRGVFVWHWKLYSVAGQGICDVRYFDMKADGAPLERWKLLGYERPGEMPDRLARTQKTDLFIDYERMCKQMREQGDPEPDIQAAARCANRGKWKRVEKRKRNVCKIPERAAERKREAQRKKAEARQAKAKQAKAKQEQPP